MDALSAEGIPGGMSGEVEFSAKYPLFRENCGPADLPVAERIRRELLVFNLYPELTRSDLDDIISGVTKVVKAYSVRD